MKRLFVFLVLIVMSGSAFAQALDCEAAGIDDECVCDFARKTSALADNAGAMHDFTETYQDGSAYFVDVFFRCPGNGHQQWVSIVLVGGREKLCRVENAYINDVGDANAPCVIFPSDPDPYPDSDFVIPAPVDFPDYTGKQSAQAKSELKDYMEQREDTGWE